MAFTDIAFGGDWKLHRGPAVFLERRTIGLHQRRHFAEPAGVHNEPRIANPRRAPYRHLGLPGDIERWSAARSATGSRRTSVATLRPRRDIAAMADDLRADLDQLLAQARQRRW